MAKKEDNNRLLTLTEASELYEAHRRRLGIDHPQIASTTLKVYCWQGKLRAEKYGKMWLVRPTDVLRFAEHNPGPGPGGVARKRRKRRKRAVRS